MSVKKDLINKKFGKLLVKDKCIIKQNRTYWLCECECGSNIYVYRGHLLNEHTKSCGCLQIKHNKYKTRIYHIWGNMKYRCNTPSCSAYHNYGGKGVKVCDEWNNVENGFINFYNWAMDNGYKDNLTIDRIDSNGNYEPNNCRWVTKSKNTAYGNIKTVRRKANNGTYYGISPTNEYYEFDNANSFARQHNLNANLLRDMANKTKYKNSKYKGWIFGFVKDLK